jgi:hypothetical protein
MVTALSDIRAKKNPEMLEDFWEEKRAGTIHLIKRILENQPTKQPGVVACAYSPGHAGD